MIAASILAKMESDRRARGVEGLTAGVDLRTAQELMGHKDIAMTMRYASLAQP